jgi:hypothetical protein
MPELPARRIFLIAAAFLVVALTGCASIGPKSVVADRFDYSESIADSWKRQTLLNIVKMRYADLPVFVDVSSIVAGYSLETDLNAGVNLTFHNGKANTGNFSGSSKYTDRPTITYMPMTGEKFLRGLITPIDPKTIFSMLQSGYAADFILGMTVDSLNGVRNRSAAAGLPREADPEFQRALVLLHDVQAAGDLGMRVEDDKTRGQTAVLFFRRDDISPDIAAKMAEIRTLLKLTGDEPKFSLIYSPVRAPDNQLAVNSRSMLQIMMAFGSYIDVPAEHVADHSALPGVGVTDESGVHILSGKEPPASAYASVRYRGYWFWIDEGDLRSKRALSAVMFFFTLIDTGNVERAPVITIPAQ